MKYLVRGALSPDCPQTRHTVVTRCRLFRNYPAIFHKKLTRRKFIYIADPYRLSWVWNTCSFLSNPAIVLFLMSRGPVTVNHFPCSFHSARKMAHRATPRWKSITLQIGAISSFFPSPQTGGEGARRADEGMLIRSLFLVFISLKGLGSFTQ